MKKIIISVLVILFCISCSSGPVKMTKEGREVQIVNKANISGCDIVGKVYGKDEQGSEDIAKVDLKNAAAEMEVDTLVINETVQNGKITIIHAMGYKCNQAEE